MPTLTFDDVIAKPELHVLLLAWSAKHHLDDQMKFVLDLHAKVAPEKLYNTYIKEGAPMELNISSSIMATIRRKAGVPGGFGDMGDDLKAASSKVLTEMIKPAFNAGGQSFEQFDGYQRFLGLDPSNAQVNKVLSALALDKAKNKQMAPLLKMYFEGRTATDAWQAYLAMQKIVSTSKLFPVLRTMPKDPQTLESSYKMERHLELEKKIAPTMKLLEVDVPEANRYLTSALAALKSKGKPKDPVEVTRMYNSGRMRVEKVTNNYTAAARIQSDLTKSHEKLVTAKKKMDTDWAAYKKALGK